MNKCSYRLRRSLRVGAIVILAAIAGVVKVTSRSNIRAVDLITILGTGVALGVFIANIAMMYRFKKMTDLK